ncbi:MAG: thioredoxin family protein [Polyangiaceae bacterium]
MSLRTLFASLSLVSAACALGCSSYDAAPEATSAPSATAGSTAAAAPRKVEWVHVPAGADPHAYVKDELARAKADQKKLVLYVGAKWCEPCNNFHEATDRGELDEAFPDLRLVAFDHDDEASAISALGCDSNYIPMFSVPDEEGRCTRRQIQGGIKGANNVAFISKKLRNLIGP